MVALNLDLWPLSEKLARTVQLRYPNTRAVYNNLSTLYYFKKEYANAQEIIDYSARLGCWMKRLLSLKEPG